MALVTVEAPEVGMLQFHCHNGDHIERVMQQSGRIYEWDLLQHIAQTVPREGMWIDVGAFIGTHSVFFAKLGVEIEAYEPIPSNFLLLERNLEANEVDDISYIHPVALGDSSRDPRISYAEMSIHTSNMGMCHIIKAFQEEDGDTPDKTLMSYLDASIIDTEQRIGLIKLDVEGYELEVLKGAHETLTRWHPVLFIELQTREQILQADALLRPYGYKRSPGHWARTPVYEFR